MDQDQAQQQTRQHDKNLARNNSRVFLDCSETNQHVKVLSEPSSQNGGEIKEDIRCWMVGLVEGLGRDAFKGAWRDNWLKSRKQEMIRKIESGSLKEMCSALVKMELEMNWNAFSAHFGEQRERILSVLRKGDDAPDVLRELLVFIGEISSGALVEGCSLHERLNQIKRNELDVVSGEKASVHQQSILVAERHRKSLKTKPTKAAQPENILKGDSFYLAWHANFQNLILRLQLGQIRFLKIQTTEVLQMV